MAAYRFCRTDDIALLTDALNRCWSPYFPDDPSMTPAAFKQAIRYRQVWCSSCMVAFAGADPIGVLIGAKRPSGTLVHRIAVHPDHRRQEHGRHLLTSLAAKLAILGPPRTIAEVPETLGAACGLFTATGYVREALLTDYVWEGECGNDGREIVDATGGPAPSTRSGSSRAQSREEPAPHGAASRLGFVIPVTIDDLDANGLLDDIHPQACWERSVETLTARKNEIAGLAVATDERIEAYLLYASSASSAERLSETAAPATTADVELLAIGSAIDDGGFNLRRLLSRLRAQTLNTMRLPKVHPAEFSATLLQTLGFRPAGGHVLYAAGSVADQARPS